jgi:hypothetical protein
MSWILAFAGMTAFLHAGMHQPLAVTGRSSVSPSEFWLSPE